MSINKVTLLGNVCANPEIKTFENGGKIAQFSLATNERAFKTKDGREIPEKTEFHNIVINMAGLADVAEKYIHKGDKLYIEGKIKTRSYESKTGEKHNIAEIYVSVLEMLSKPAAAPAAPTPEPAPEPFYEKYKDI